MNSPVNLAYNPAKQSYEALSKHSNILTFVAPGYKRELQASIESWGLGFRGNLGVEASRRVLYEGLELFGSGFWDAG